MARGNFKVPMAIPNSHRKKAVGKLELIGGFCFDFIMGINAIVKTMLPMPNIQSCHIYWYPCRLVEVLARVSLNKSLGR